MALTTRGIGAPSSLAVAGLAGVVVAANVLAATTLATASGTATTSALLAGNAYASALATTTSTIQQVVAATGGGGLSTRGLGNPSAIATRGLAALAPQATQIQGAAVSSATALGTATHALNGVLRAFSQAQTTTLTSPKTLLIGTASLYALASGFASYVIRLFNERVSFLSKDVRYLTLPVDTGASMTDYTLIPPPVTFGAMWTTDKDGSFTLDCTANMTARGDTISAVGTPVIQRTDGMALTAQDLTVNSVSADVTGYKVNFFAQANGNTATYQIGLPLTLASGNVLTRWCLIDVVSILG